MTTRAAQHCITLDWQGTKAEKTVWAGVGNMDEFRTWLVQASVNLCVRIGDVTKWQSKDCTSDPQNLCSFVRGGRYRHTSRSHAQLGRCDPCSRGTYSRSHHATSGERITAEADDVRLCAESGTFVPVR